MASCFEPGRIIVLPKSPDPDAANTIENARDVLERAGVKLQKPDAYWLLPILRAVRMGHEVEESRRAVNSGEALAACPNFYLSTASTAAVTMSEDWLAPIIADFCVSPGVFLGREVRIAVLDSGWAQPTNSARRAPAQYSAISFPAGSGDLTGHGTAVIEIIRRIAPEAEITSVQIYDRAGTVWSLLGGLLVADAACTPNIINLSLSIDCDPHYCPYCKRDGIARAQLEMMFWAFRQRPARMPTASPTIVAAAGNNRHRCALPAAFRDVVAVGAFDAEVGAQPQYSQYDAVPTGRFLLAPGSDDPAKAIATVSSGAACRPQALYGTSFSAPVVTGIAARILSGVGPIPNGCTDLLLEYFASSADRRIAGYDPLKHGLGRVRFQPNLIGDVAHLHEMTCYFMRAHAAQLRRLVLTEAQSIYEEHGRPEGMSEEHWQLARQYCSIPDDVQL